MTNKITNITGYQFIENDDVESAHKKIQAICNQTHLKGTIFISPEGINLSLAGNQSDIDFAIDQLKSVCGFTQLLLNTTYSVTIPFKRLLVKFRDELVPTKSKSEKVAKINEKFVPTKSKSEKVVKTNEKFVPTKSKLNKDVQNGSEQTLSKQKCNSPVYITSEKLKQWLDNGKDFVLLDLRNAFEYRLGSFNHAKHLELNHFRELENTNDRLNDIPKDKPLVTFCTGGIRCEKGAPYIAQQGFEHVYQLKGGILNYLNEFKDNYWHGDCFVFDERVCLDHELNPTYAVLCRSCQSALHKNEERFCSTCASLI